MTILKRATSALLALALAMVFPTGCSDSNNSGGNAFFTFEDDVQSTVILRESPQRVAVLFSSLAQMWQLAGGEVSVTVGESVERGFADDGTPLVDSGAGKAINNELLVASAPDLVIGSADIAAHVQTAELMREVGIPVALFRIDDFDDYSHAMEILCGITQRQDLYTANVSAPATQIESIKGSVPSGEQKRILFIRCGSSYNATKAKTAKDNFVCAMLDRLGTYNIANNAPILLDGLSIEEILVQDPEYIFFSTMGNEEKAKEYMNGLLQTEVWQSLNAVKNGCYTYLPKELFQYKPNHRWAEAYQYLFDQLYE